jgi:hypothetical protein
MWRNTRGICCTGGGDAALCRDNSPALARLWLSGSRVHPAGPAIGRHRRRLDAQPRRSTATSPSGMGGCSSSRPPIAGHRTGRSVWLEPRAGPEWREAPQGRLAGSEVPSRAVSEWFRRRLRAGWRPGR